MSIVLGEILNSNHSKLFNRTFNLWIIESIRILFYLLAVATAVVSQLLNPYFVNFDIWWPVYLLVIFGLLVHFTFTGFLEKLRQTLPIDLFLFIFDSLFITSIVYFTYFSYPLFTLFYLVNIILCSFVLGSASSLFVSSISSLLYIIVFNLRIDNYADEQLTLLLNLFSFFLTALFSGYLGDVFILRSKELISTKKDLSSLQNLSQIIIDNIGSGLVFFENNKKISFINPSAEKIFGNSAKTAIRSIENEILFSNKDVQKLERKEIDLDIDGIQRNLEFITTYIPNPDTSNSWITLVQDLTQIKSLQKELAQNEKLAAIGRLAGGIAHEIRNPLASISGSVEMLKESTERLDPENTKLFSIIIKEIDRLNNLITDFLSFVRPEVKRSDSVFVNQIIEDIFAILKNNKDLATGVEFSIKMEEVKIKCDKSKLTQAFINIITNALQAIKNENQPQFSCVLKKEGMFVAIEFSDNGPGIPKGVVENIFEPFYTTKDKGTGLGLAITHRIIEGHDGLIKVLSGDKKGTTFFIRLPIN